MWSPDLAGSRRVEWASIRRSSRARCPDRFRPPTAGDRPEAGAAVPDDVGFATKPQQARTMLEQAIAAGVPFAWFTAFGQNPGLRDWLEEQDIAYVMATRNDDEVPAGLHTVSPVKAMIATIWPGAWRRMSCGDGAHGPRVYHWAWTPIRTEFAHGRRGWVLARRSIGTGEIAYYRCFGRRGTQLRDLVRVAGSRWAIEQSFQTAKNEVGLDQCQVRRYDAWYAHITLAMTAAAFLVVTRAAEAARGVPAQARQADPTDQQRDPPPVHPVGPDHHAHR
ncbi:transposase [Micromonospora sp. NPDC048170]|uniref:IS701 family transposase n=1 Tax=Micromonospora sp. NPDC048170 TaxID=3154819 RepID=UPI0033DB33FE